MILAVGSAHLAAAPSHEPAMTGQRDHAARTPPREPVDAPADAAPADMLLRAGQSAFQAARYAEAATSFLRFFELYGQSAEAQAAREQLFPMLAGALLAAGRPADALPFLRQYLSLFPAGKARAEMSLWCGLAMLLQKDCAGAIAMLDQFCADYPRHEQADDASFLAAIAARDAADISGAAKRFSRLTNAPDPLIAERASLMRVQCEIDLGHPDEALRLLEPLAKKNPPPRQQALAAAQALSLGDEFMRRDDAEKAWRCYLLVPTRDRILRRHADAMAEIDRRTVAGAKDTVRPGPPGQTDRLLEAMRAEKIAIEKIPDFDAGRHMRLARAAFQLGWHWEASIAANAAASCLPDGSAARADADFLSVLACVESRRWPRALDQCASFLKRHAQEPRAAKVLFLAAHARFEMRDYAAAREAFLSHYQSHPDCPEADRSLFLAGYCALCLGLNAEAEKTFADVCRSHRTSPLCEQARYWNAMAAIFSKNYDAAIERFDSYLAAHPTGAFKAEAIYRKAAARYAKREFDEARRTLRRWLDDFEGDPLEDEVRALYGDCLLTSGDIDGALKSYRAIAPDKTSLWHYAQFQIAKALRLSERNAELVTHLRSFIAGHPDSPRMAEALRSLTKALGQHGREEAISLYRDAIARVGNDPLNGSADALFTDLAAMHRTPDERSGLETNLRHLAQKVTAETRDTFAARCIWTISKLARREKERALNVLLELGRFRTDDLPPRVAMDLAEALVGMNRADEAAPHFERLISMGPAIPEFAGALAGLGLIASLHGDKDRALELFDRFGREAKTSPLLARVLEARADILLGRGRHADAIPVLEQLLEIPSAAGASKARALCRLGESHIALGQPEKAIPCYQRVYVMYGAHQQWVAKAYLECGQTLERLKLWDGARKTYEELLGREELGAFAEYARARTQLANIR